jgi:Cu(I)/Ag(I) efflux system protein CusF
MKEIAMKFTTTLSLILALSGSSVAMAQSSGMKDIDKKDLGMQNCMDMKGSDMKGMDMKDMDAQKCKDMMKGMDGKHATTDANAVTYQAAAVVKQVDAANGKVTLAHEAVKSLNWPAMTMGFAVKQPREGRGRCRSHNRAHRFGNPIYEEDIMNLKYVVAVIRADVLDALEVKLASLQVRGLTVSKVKGFGEYVDFLAKSHLTEHIKVEIFVEDSKAEAVAAAIMDIAHSEVPGAGIVAMMPVEKFFHIRTRSETLPDEP